MNANLAATTKKELFRLHIYIPNVGFSRPGFVVGSVRLPCGWWYWWYRAQNVGRQNRSNVNAIFWFFLTEHSKIYIELGCGKPFQKKVDHCSFTRSNEVYSVGRISVLRRVGKVIQNAVLNSQSRDCFTWIPKDTSFSPDKRVFCMAFVSSLHLFCAYNERITSQKLKFALTRNSKKKVVIKYLFDFTLNAPCYSHSM